ncbi:Orn/Lys/Arg decarboxylase, C-terminal domain [Musa troglodytarum]|nr:Orn/Lys/Arg decarboxylase, C-terminal domain [Musa troglodytarum]
MVSDVEQTRPVTSVDSKRKAGAASSSSSFVRVIRSNLVRHDLLPDQQTCVLFHLWIAGQVFTSGGGGGTGIPDDIERWEVALAVVASRPQNRW